MTDSIPPKSPEEGAGKPDELEVARQADHPLEAELRTGRTLVVRYSRSRNEIAGILAAVQNAGLTILDLTTEESDLEDVFLDITGNGNGKSNGKAPLQ